MKPKVAPRSVLGKKANSKDLRRSIPSKIQSRLEKAKQFPHNDVERLARNVSIDLLFFKRIA